MGRILLISGAWQSTKKAKLISFQYRSVTELVQTSLKLLSLNSTTISTITSVLMTSYIPSGGTPMTQILNLYDQGVENALKLRTKCT